MLILAIMLGGLGLMALLVKRTFIGVLVGVHLLFLSVTVAFALSGLGSGEFTRGYVFALFAAVLGICHLILGWALALRLYYLGGTSRMASLRNLRG